MCRWPLTLGATSSAHLCHAGLRDPSDKHHSHEVKHPPTTNLDRTAKVGSIKALPFPTNAATVSSCLQAGGWQLELAQKVNRGKMDFAEKSTARCIHISRKRIFRGKIRSCIPVARFKFNTPPRNLNFSTETADAANGVEVGNGKMNHDEWLYLFQVYTEIDADGVFRMYEALPAQMARLQELNMESSAYVKALFDRGYELVQKSAAGDLEGVHEDVTELRQDEMLIMTTDRMFKGACLQGQLHVVRTLSASFGLLVQHSRVCWRA